MIVSKSLLEGSCAGVLVLWHRVCAFGSNRDRFRVRKEIPRSGRIRGLSPDAGFSSEWIWINSFERWVRIAVAFSTLGRLLSGSPVLAGDTILHGRE